MDRDGVFKYLIIEIRNKMEWEDDKPEVKRVVRGYESCVYHADILNKFI